MLRGFSPQQAVDAPRFCVQVDDGVDRRMDTTTSIPNTDNTNAIIFFEDTFEPEVVTELQGTLHVHALQLCNDVDSSLTLSNRAAGMGHVVQVVSGTARSLMGRAQLIERSVHVDGVVWGAGKWVCLNKEAIA